MKIVIPAMLVCFMAGEQKVVRHQKRTVGHSVGLPRKEEPITAADFFKYHVYLRALREGMDENKALFEGHLCGKGPAELLASYSLLFQPNDYYKLGNSEDAQKTLQALCAAAHDCFFIGLEIRMRYKDAVDSANGSLFTRYKRSADRMLAALKRCRENHTTLSDCDYLSDCRFAPEKAEELLKVIDKARHNQKKKGQFIGSDACLKICQIVACFTP